MLLCSVVAAKNGSASKSSTVGMSGVEGGREEKQVAVRGEENVDRQSMIGKHNWREMASNERECHQNMMAPDAPCALNIELSMMRMWGDVHDGKWLSCMAGDAMMWPAASSKITAPKLLERETQTLKRGASRRRR